MNRAYNNYDYMEMYKNMDTEEGEQEYEDFKNVLSLRDKQKRERYVKKGHTDEAQILPS